MQDEHTGIIFLAVLAKQQTSGLNQQKVYINIINLKQPVHVLEVHVIALDAVCVRIQSVPFWDLCNLERKVFVCLGWLDDVKELGTRMPALIRWLTEAKR